ncbi:MAG TPA: N-acetyltransferase [Hansschlegelia sp.]
MVHIRDEAPDDAGAREALLDRAFGPARFAKTCERLREGRLPAAGLSLAAEQDGTLVGTLRFWHVALGDGRPGLMLGPLAVDAEARCGGVGSALMRAGLDRARALGHEAVILVGDAPYYERFGFSAEATERLAMPGPVERDRFLGVELQPGALASAAGVVRPTGAIRLPERRAAVRSAPKRAA